MPLAPSGSYSVRLDGVGVTRVFCDMDTDGGGWTVLWSTSGGDNALPFSSDEALSVSGPTPLAGGSYNLPRAMKAALSSVPSDTLVRRSSSKWIVANHAPVSPAFATAGSDEPLFESYPVRLSAAAGVEVVHAFGELSWSTGPTAGGGDFSLSSNLVARQGSSSQADLVASGCSNQYLYSYSTTVLDGDGAYASSLGLGAWDAQGSCDGAEGGGFAVLVAVREQEECTYPWVG